MVLKKQTVWLITMLSLLIVLSVYYMLPGDDQVAMTDGDEDQQEDERSEGEAGDESMGENFVVSELATDDYFQTIRLETEDSRSELKEQLSEVISSTTATSEEKNDAMNQIYSLETASQKESLLEKMIIQEKDFQDVLVRQDEDRVNVTVMANELSKTDANHIMQMARDEFGITDVSVKYQTAGEQPSLSDDDQPDDSQEDQQHSHDDSDSDGEEDESSSDSEEEESSSELEDDEEDSEE